MSALNVNKERITVISPAIFALTLGALASLFVIISAFSLNRKTILLSLLITNFLTGAQFIILGEIPTTFLIAVSALYTGALMMEKILPFVRSNAFTIGILAVQTVGYFAINGMRLDWSLLALSGTIVGSLAMWFKNPIHLKATMLLMGFIWLAYQLVSGAYGQIPGELVFLAGIIASLVMLTNAKNQGLPLDAVEEIPALLRRKFGNRQATKENVAEPVFS